MEPVHITREEFARMNENCMYMLWIEVRESVFGRLTRNLCDFFWECIRLIMCLNEGFGFNMACITTPALLSTMIVLSIYINAMNHCIPYIYNTAVCFMVMHVIALTASLRLSCLLLGCCCYIEPPRTVIWSPHFEPQDNVVNIYHQLNIFRLLIFAGGIGMTIVWIITTYMPVVSNTTDGNVTECDSENDYRVLKIMMIFYTWTMIPTIKMIWVSLRVLVCYYYHGDSGRRHGRRDDARNDNGQREMPVQMIEVRVISTMPSYAPSRMKNEIKMPKKIYSNTPYECSICYAENYDIMPCGHLLCKECHNQITKSNNVRTHVCPTCRRSIDTTTLSAFERFVKKSADESGVSSIIDAILDEICINDECSKQIDEVEVNECEKYRNMGCLPGMPLECQIEIMNTLTLGEDAELKELCLSMPT